MTYKLSTIARILGVSDAIMRDIPIDILLTDSRAVTDGVRSMFFALRTASGDGHRYIRQLYDHGVRAFVVENIPPEASTTMADATFLKVASPLKALQTLARAHRASFTSIPVIGITGSRGKTTVKEWLCQLLHDDYVIVRSPRSFNSQIGVPLSVWEMDASTTLGIFEAGISQPREMTILESIIRPTIGVITNLGDAHSEGFASPEEKCDEKVTLMREAECVVYCADNPVIAATVARECTSAQEMAWSEHNADLPLYIRSITTGDKSSTIDFFYLNTHGAITIPFTERRDVENAIHCLAVMLYLMVSIDEISRRMERLTPVNTRLSVIEGVNNCMIVSDGYSADLHSLTPALDFVGRRVTAERSVTVILSDLLHESYAPDDLYRAVARLMRTRHVNRFIGIGEEISRYRRYFDVNASFYPSTEQFMASVSAGDFSDELILIKGTPDFGFEVINEMLEARHHETVLHVNLDAMVHNYNYYRSCLHPDTGLVAMIKASGYGAGSYELAKTLQSQGATYLAVAVLDEGVDLRHAGITMPIMVLNPKVTSYRTLFAYHLEPEIYSFDILNEIIAEAKKYGVKDYPIHIKLDTGMHRLGFTEEELPELLTILCSQNAVSPRSVFSHLATADCPDMNDYTAMQLDTFDRCAQIIQDSFSHHILKHILNSAGITRFRDRHDDLARLGIGLYGISPLGAEEQACLQPVSTLTTIITALHRWPTGTSIGYSRRGRLKRDSVIATLPVGYADGIDRHLGCGRISFWVNGVLCPTVGNICMDACMIDVTDCPSARVGDTVEVFGPHVSVLHHAEVLDTIPYEILTSVSPRVKRVYYRE